MSVERTMDRREEQKNRLLQRLGSEDGDSAKSISLGVRAWDNP